MDMGVERKSNYREKFRIRLFAVLHDVQTVYDATITTKLVVAFQIL